MKGLLILTIALILEISCARQTPSTGESQSQGRSTPEGSPSQVASPEPTKETEKKKNVPAEFRHIDFANRAYPVTLNRKTIRLKDGEFEYREGIGGNSYELGDVSYAD